MTTAQINMALIDWDGPMGLPRFDQFKDEDFAAALKLGFDQDLEEANAISENSEAPTFENTIEALERKGQTLGRVATIFYTKAGNHTNETIQKLEREFSPLFARHAGEIAKNKKLFQRIDDLWQRREQLGLSGEQFQLLKKYHRNFIKMGAALEGEKQAQLIEVNEQLARLGTQFSQNVLKDESDWVLYLSEEAELEGLPTSLRDAMAAAAHDRGEGGKFAVTLGRSIVSPFLTHADRRDLRERAYNAWISRGENNGDSDNRPIISQTLKLRARRAELLGYDTFAHLKLENTMAKTPQAVNTLLNTVWEKAKQRADEEAGDIEELMRKGGHNHDLAGWDWRYFAEKIRAERYAYSDDEIRPYMRLENMIEAAFWVANKLFGLTFEEKHGIALFHPDTRVWEVRNAEGSHQGLFVGDYFARPSKRSGAWMSALQIQSRLLDETPIITNTMNFAKPPQGEDAYLTFDDARTLFHEFGHALHGMLSEVDYPSLSGTNVARDFVELPSQLYEHWLTVPEVLNRFATHQDDSKPMPAELLDKVLAARNFNMGHDTVEYTASAIVDMAYHQGTEAPADAATFEAALLKDLEKPDPIAMRHRSPHFQHIFSGDGYAAGYYSYMWSEVLDADAFLAFEETDDPFDSQMAERLRKSIYASGGTMEPEEAYIGFRGKLPTPDAMLEKRGLS